MTVPKSTYLQLGIGICRRLLTAILGNAELLPKEEEHLSGAGVG